MRIDFRYSGTIWNEKRKFNIEHIFLIEIKVHCNEWSPYASYQFSTMSENKSHKKRNSRVWEYIP